MIKGKKSLFWQTLNEQKWIKLILLNQVVDQLIQQLSIDAYVECVLTSMQLLAIYVICLRCSN